LQYKNQYIAARDRALKYNDEKNTAVSKLFESQYEVHKNSKLLNYFKYFN
jgi:hypothetical protein